MLCLILSSAFECYFVSLENMKVLHCNCIGFAIGTLVHWHEVWVETKIATMRCVSQELNCHVRLMADILDARKEKMMLNPSSAITRSFTLSYLAPYALISSYIE